MSIFHTKWTAVIYVKIVKSYEKPHYSTSNQIFEKTQVVFHKNGSSHSQKSKGLEEKSHLPRFKVIRLELLVWTEKNQNISVFRCA